MSTFNESRRKAYGDACYLSKQAQLVREGLAFYATYSEEAWEDLMARLVLIEQSAVQLRLDLAKLPPP